MKNAGILLRTICLIAVALGAGVTPALAQDAAKVMTDAKVAQLAMADDRDKVVGTWKLISWEVEFQDSGKREPVYGAHPNGYIIFTSQGRMMALLEGEGRKTPQTDDERVKAFQSMVAYSGAYTVEGDRWNVKVDTTWNPAWRGTDQSRTFKVEGERLSVIAMWQPQVNFGGRVGRGVLTFERAK